MAKSKVKRKGRVALVKATKKTVKRILDTGNGTCRVYCGRDRRYVGKNLSETEASDLVKTHCTGKHNKECKE